MNPLGFFLILFVFTNGVTIFISLYSLSLSLSKCGVRFLFSGRVFFLARIEEKKSDTKKNTDDKKEQEKKETKQKFKEQQRERERERERERDHRIKYYGVLLFCTT